MAYLRPGRLDEAIALLAQAPAVPLAGGTDFYPARAAHMPDETVLDLTGIAADVRAADIAIDRVVADPPETARYSCGAGIGRAIRRRAALPR